MDHDLSLYSVRRPSIVLAFPPAAAVIESPKAAMTYEFFKNNIGYIYTNREGPVLDNG
jgi:hypothetical protein